jgi:DNA processing protein
VQRATAARICASRRDRLPEQLHSGLASKGLWFVAYGTPGYPKELLALSQPPVGLFVRGVEARLDALLAYPRITIVGTRRASAYGTRAARDFASAFAGRGITVLSGLALGVDGRAHEAALEAEGLTVAVMGCGADVIYPSRHRALYHLVAEKGLVVSELPPGTPPSRWSFPQRNRLLAALGDACMVVEGSVTSGAMQTAGQAAALGRPVFAVPGSIYVDNHRGCNLLLSEGAVPALEPGGAVEEFLVQTRIERGDRQPPVWEKAPVLAARGREPFERLAAVGREAILEALAARPCSVDALVACTGLSVRYLTAALAELELAGLAARAGPGLYIRAP